MPLLQKGCFPYRDLPICMYQLWMSRPGPKSEGMDENRVEYRYPVHFQQQHSVQTTSTYVLKYRVMYTVQIHTFILRTFAIICICNCTYKYLMQGSQDPNWNKRHQYRGRLIPLSSVLDPLATCRFPSRSAGEWSCSCTNASARVASTPLPVWGRERTTVVFTSFLIISIVVARCSLSESPGER